MSNRRPYISDAQTMSSAGSHGSSIVPHGERDYTKIIELREIFTVEEIEEYKGLFDMFDMDGSGDISIKELTTLMRQLGQNPTEEEI